MTSFLSTTPVRKVKIHHVQADREIICAYYGNTTVDLDPLPMSRARLTVVEPAFLLSETCLKWHRWSKVPPNERCVPSCDLSTQMVNVQRKFTNKLLLFMVTLWFPLVSPSKETSRWEKVRRRWWGSGRSHDVFQRAGGRLLWLGDTKAGSKT